MLLVVEDEPATCAIFGLLPVLEILIQDDGKVWLLRDLLAPKALEFVQLDVDRALGLSTGLSSFS